ncbi:hypothetical protein D3C81_1873590 [compost metagenome]
MFAAPGGTKRLTVWSPSVSSPSRIWKASTLGNSGVAAPLTVHWSQGTPAASLTIENTSVTRMLPFTSLPAQSTMVPSGVGAVGVPGTAAGSAPGGDEPK